MESLSGNTISDGVRRAGPITNRPPSPPYIHIPTPLSLGPDANLNITPSYEHSFAGNLTAEDFSIITGGVQQRINSYAVNQSWVYEDRRKMQMILDYLYLGPMSTVRDRNFLRKEGFTLLLAARDACMAQFRMVMIDKAVEELGIEAAYVDIASQDWIPSLADAVDKINAHMLRFNKAQAAAAAAAVAGPRPRRGKVLVFCETGNERSATVVAAYLMTMFGRTMVQSLQFVSTQRFCCNFDEETKHRLQSYWDLLHAQQMTMQANRAQKQALNPPHQLAGEQARTPSRKRGIEDTMDEDEDMDNFAMDMGRYEDRPPFAPFIQGDPDVNMK